MRIGEGRVALHSDGSTKSPPQLARILPMAALPLFTRSQASASLRARFICARCEGVSTCISQVSVPGNGTSTYDLGKKALSPDCCWWGEEKTPSTRRPDAPRPRSNWRGFRIISSDWSSSFVLARPALCLLHLPTRHPPKQMQSMRVELPNYCC
jgi:hypothetical protein